MKVIGSEDGVWGQGSRLWGEWGGGGRGQGGEGKGSQ